VPSFGGATVRCVARCYGPLPLGSERYTQAMDPLRHVTRAQKFALARRLRRAATPAERHAWSLLRNRGVLGLKFRRQHVVHGFIVDFHCLAERLVLELEGDAHDGNDRQTYDAARARFLEAAGYRVVRVRNSDVMAGRLEALLRRALRRRSIVPPLRRERGPGGEDD
jgi:very-short-patch-repair endonuclease